MLDKLKGLENFKELDKLKENITRRHLVIGGVALALVAVLYFLMRPQPVSADFGAVDKGDLAIAVAGEGKTRVREIYTVSAPIAGRMERIRFEPGDPVAAEESVLARIEPADPLFLDVRSSAQAKADVDAATASVALSRAKLTRAQAERTFARSELKRAEELYQKGNISSRALEKAQLEARMRGAEVDTARSDLAVALASLEAARARLIQPSDNKGRAGQSCCLAVRSPVSGQVLRVPDKSERVVAVGEALIEVGDPADLEAVIDILSTDAVKVRPGDKAYIEQWGGGAPFAAVVSRVEPAGFTKISALGIEEQRVNVILAFTAPGELWARLGDHYRVEARIIIRDVKDTLRVPISALFRRGDQWTVFVVKRGRARERVVEIAARNDIHAAVTSGLEVGETVILHPGEKVRDGVRVRRRND